ncbi:MAG TPA: FecR domain-containing protein [Steroidobacteraceae bacterium]|nr:FecR domain-containing protein [Steroidobacteraceae bacterium]
MSGDHGERGSAESDEDRMLRTGLEVSPLSPEAMSRIRAATEAEWRANIRRAPRRWLRYAAAAGFFAVALLGGWYVMGPAGRTDHGELAAHLVRFEAPGVLEEHLLRADTALNEGSVLRSGRSYEVSGQALINLEGGGTLRLAPGSEIEIVAKDDFRLEKGEMYVDIPPDMGASSTFIARTAAGQFHHVGTQFALAVIETGTRLRVREGSVHWLAAGGESTVKAGTEVVFSNGVKAAERPLAPSGKEWDWTAQTTPDFEIDNRPLEEFLEWVARESGRTLVLADDQARKQAATIRMHGSVHGLTPMQALSAVMATTELRYDLPDGQIRVSFASETPRRR